MLVCWLVLSGCVRGRARRLFEAALSWKAYRRTPKSSKTKKPSKPAKKGKKSAGSGGDSGSGSASGGGSYPYSGGSGGYSSYPYSGYGSGVRSGGYGSYPYSYSYSGYGYSGSYPHSYPYSYPYSGSGSGSGSGDRGSASKRGKGKGDSKRGGKKAKANKGKTDTKKTGKSSKRRRKSSVKVVSGESSDYGAAAAAGGGGGRGRGLVRPQRNRAVRHQVSMAINEAARARYQKIVGPIETTVDRIYEPTAEIFVENYVKKNKPVIICGALHNWGALSKWSLDYMSSVVGYNTVTVNRMPSDGQSGRTLGAHHIDPMPVQMPFRDFAYELQLSIQDRQRDVHYMSVATNRFALEFAPLAGDIAPFPFMPWTPTHTNIWLGEERAVSPVHHDYYENLYSVITGKKIFRLFHPLDAAYMYLTRMRHGNLWRDIDDPNSQWTVIEDSPTFWQGWPAVDAINPDLNRHPFFAKANPIPVEVNAGEVLFIPYLWFHHVSQVGDAEGKCVAINYWYPPSPHHSYVDLLDSTDDAYMDVMGERFHYSDSSEYDNKDDDFYHYGASSSEVSDTEWLKRALVRSVVGNKQ